MNVVGAIIAGLMLMAGFVWGVMLLAGTIAGWFDWHSLGYGQTWAGLAAIAVIGGAFRGSNTIDVRIKK